MKRVSFSAILVALVLGVMARPSSATILIQDTFTGTAGATVIGTSPPVNATVTNKWTEARTGATSGVTFATDSGLGVAKLQQPSGTAGRALELNLAGLNTNQLLTVSASFRFDLNGATPGGGTIGSRTSAGVGFFSSGPTASPRESVGYFAGFALGPKNAANSTTLALKLINNNSPPLSVALAPLYNNATVVAQQDYTGSRSATAYHDLVYTVDTSTGSLVSVVLDGQSYNFGTQTFFTNANTAFFGVHSGPETATIGYFDSVQLESVPEPVASSIMVLGFVAIFRFRRRR
jgi:hypothetical protein